MLKAISNRRNTLRQRALKEAKVLLSDSTAIDCVIRDMSDTGARLEFQAPTALPEAIRLLIVSSNLVVPAEPVWQRGHHAGIRYTGTAKAAAPRKSLRPAFLPPPAQLEARKRAFS